MNSLFPSVMRTAVPYLVGCVLTATGALGFELDSTAVASGVTSAVALAYYGVFRLAEAAAARIGWEPGRIAAGLLLGWARPPQYPSKAPALTLPPHQ